MRATSHLVFNTAIAVSLLDKIHLPLNSFWFLGGVLLGSLLPDMDKKGSKAANMGFRLRMEHRGLTHSLLGFLSVSALVLLFTKLDFGLGIILGYGGHILEDMMTTNGVSLFYPEKTKIRFPLRIKTGGMIEKLLLLFTVVYLAFSLKK